MDTHVQDSCCVLDTPDLELGFLGAAVGGVDGVDDPRMGEYSLLLPGWRGREGPRWSQSPRGPRSLCFMSEDLPPMAGTGCGEERQEHWLEAVLSHMGSPECYAEEPGPPP